MTIQDYIAAMKRRAHQIKADHPELGYQKRLDVAAREFGFPHFTSVDKLLKLLGEGGVPTRTAISDAGGDPNLSPLSPFTKRPRGEAVMYVGSYRRGGTFDLEVRDGDSVDLRIGEERVLVDNVVTLAGGRYRGEIRAFDTTGAEEIAGLREWDTVEFEQLHIHGCNHR